MERTSTSTLEWDYTEALVLCVIPVGLLLLFGVVLPLTLAALGLAQLAGAQLLPGLTCLFVAALGVHTCWNLRDMATEQLQAFVRAQARLRAAN